MERKSRGVSRFLYLSLICFLLSGCTKFVYVPVPSCPYTPIPVKQELKTKNMSEQTESKEVLRALACDMVYLNSYSEQLKLLLEGYNQISSGPPIKTK